jgi:Tol biopolymer transport system component
MQLKQQGFCLRHPVVWPAAVWIVLLISGCGGKSPAYPTTPSAVVSTASPTVAGTTDTPVASREAVPSHPVTQLTHCQPQCFFPAWSPDGGQIAYFSGAEGIMLMDDNGGNAHPLTTQMAGWAPVWSPDGKRIAFTDGPGGALYVAADDGSNLTRISDRMIDPQINPPYIPSYRWSPDGKSLAFATAGQKQSELWLMDITIGQSRSIFSGPSTIQILGWPEGVNIYILLEQGDGQVVYRVNVDGSEKSQSAQLAREVIDVAMSPDGTQIVFSSIGADGNAEGFWILTVNDSRKRILMPNAASSPAWSPDGRRIAFVYTGENNDLDIYVISAVGSGLMDVTNHADFADDSPVWSPDGARLAFVARTFTKDGFGADDQIYVVDVPGT